MQNILLFLSLCACSYAQLIYPDEFERRRVSSTVPPYYYPSNNPRNSNLTPTEYKYSTSGSQQKSSNPPLPLLGQSSAPIPVPLMGRTVPQQNFSISPAVLGEEPLQDWGEHVNNIISRGVLKFSLDMEKEIYRSQSATAPRGNIIFSPASLTMALALVLLGSAGRTFDEVSRILGLESGVDISRHSEVVHQMFGILLHQVHEKMSKSPGPRVDFASGIFVQDGYPILPEFKAISKNVYKSEVINLDFVRRGQEAQNKINAWVKEKTMGKISSILDSLPSPATSVILMSALYFNGEWNQHFLTDATKRKQFFIEPEEPIDVDMMYNAGTFPFYEDKNLGVRILGLPYKGFDISMYVLLPDAKGAKALRNFQRQLTVDIIENLIRNLKDETCIIALPRMKLSSTLSLSSALNNLGVSSLFNPATADLSLLSQGQQTRQKLLPSTQTSPSTMGTVPTVSPLPTSGTRPPKNYPGVTKLSNTNDYLVFPRFGEDEDTRGIRRNYFTFDDKIRDLTVEQWLTGFSIARTRKMRSAGNDNGAPIQESKNSYDVSDSEPKTDNTKIVNLEENKYRFQKKEQPAARSKRQNRPIDQDFLNYIKTHNFPSFGIDDLRNSGTLVNPRLFADDVLHKVEIEISEKGTEAAAVTSVVLERDGNQRRLIANRPFLFFIRHNPSKIVLFWGTLNTPTPNYPAT